MLEFFEWLKNIISNIKSEYVALFSVLVTILIYILNKRSELKFRKYEHQKPEYENLIKFLSIAYTQQEKLQVGPDGKLNKDMQQMFYDVGASLMVFGSKKLYREYLFFRDFTSSQHIKLCKHYNEQLVVYIVANIMRQIRKEVGLTAFNQISSNEALGFIINDFATNPLQKNVTQKMNYKIRMLKVELFFMDRHSCVALHAVYFKYVRTFFGVIRCVLLYLIVLPVFGVFRKLFGKKDGSDSKS